MNNKLSQAISILREGTHCCVVVKDTDSYTAKETGVRPLLSFLHEDPRFFEGAAVADKVVGKAAAFLMILGGAEETYGQIMSESAAALLTEHGIPFSYGTLVPFIENRRRDGMCPLERAVLDSITPEDAYKALRETIANMAKNKL